MTVELHVTIGVLTYKRPDGIAKLLETLRQQVRRPERPYRLSVVVVDNDAAASSRDVVGAFAGQPAYDLHYVVEERQGIPIARNRAMDSAPEGTDLFCFLDDDEWTVDDWIDVMLATRAATNADCIHGPVEAIFDGPISPWLRKSGLYDRKHYRDGQRIDFAASNNVMFDLARFRALNIRFDERMRFTGGSDYLFFHHAHRRGIRIHWSQKALVYDIFPASRTTFKWMSQRNYRLGNTFAVATHLDGTRVEKLIQLGRGIARMGLGLALAPIGVVSPYWAGRSMVHLLRGAGITAGMLGHSYEEYAPDKVVSDSRSA